MYLALLIGLILSASLYLLAIYGFVWLGKQRIVWGVKQGVRLEPVPQFPTGRELWTRHSVEMTVIYGACFIALALAGFSIWGRLVFAGLSALVFGSLWVANRSVSIELPMASKTRNLASRIGYWCLSVADWFGYMALLCFATGLVVEAL